MAFWQVVFLTSLAAIAFILWPLVRFPFMRKSLEKSAGQDDTQVLLYEEHLTDLEKSLANGEIEETQFAELKLELQKNLVSEGATTKKTLSAGGKGLIVGLALLAPIVAFIAYTQLGSKADWDIYKSLEELPNAQSEEDYRQQLRKLGVMVQARLNQTPENMQLRNLQGQMAMTLQDYDQAVEAYEEILDQFPESPGIMSKLAQALFFRAGHQVTPEVREYIQKALSLAPMLPEMLGLAGIDAEQRGDYREAIRYWELIVKQLGPNSKAAERYLSGIQRAKAKLAEAGGAVDEPEPTPEADDGASARIDLKISLAEKVTASPNDVVFIYARAWQGPKMPLAIERHRVSDLPLEIYLDESKAMTPAMSIASFPELEVVARISRSGDVAPQSGDWEAKIGPVKISELQGALELVISDQIP